MAVSRRLSIASSRHSICGDDSSRPVSEAKDGDIGSGLIDEESTSPTATSLASFLSMSRVKQLTVISFSLSNLGVGCFFSILGPFFPNEAVKKGLSTTVVGAIIAIFELIVVLLSPVYGIYLTQIGAKFMYVAGVMICGAGTVLFGFVDGCPDGLPFAVVCFLVRVVEALGAAALTTSSFAIIANTFPNSVTAMFGSLEMFSGLGLMLGPPLGGALFEVGGFKLPFVVVGSVIFLVGLASFFVLPPQNVVNTRSDQSVLVLLKLPIVCIMGLCLISGAASITFIESTLSLYLDKQYHLSPAIIGLVFLASPAFYAFASPMWGWIVDKMPRLNKTFIVTGYTLGGFALYLMGPAPFLSIPHVLWLVVVSLALLGFGFGTLVVTFHVIAEATLDAGYSGGLSTYGLVAGIFSSCFSLGAFIGPFLGGYLYSAYEFEMSAVIIGSCSLFTALLVLLYILATLVCHKSRKDITADEDDDEIFIGEPENQPLLGDDRSIRQYGTSNQQQDQHHEQCPDVDNSKEKLAGDT